MANAVVIKMTLDSQGVVTGVKEVTDQFKVLDGGLGKTGAKSSSVLGGMTKDHQNARTSSLLLSRTLGIEVPAGLEKVMAKSPAFVGAMSKMMAVGGVLALGAALVGVMNNLDEFKKRAENFGVSLQSAWEKTRTLFTGVESDLVKGQEYMQALKEAAPLMDKAKEATRSAALAGKEGFAGVSATLKENVKDVNLLVDKIKAAGREKFPIGSTQLAEVERTAEAEGRRAVAALQRSAQRESDVLARQIKVNMSTAQKEINAIGLVGVALIVQQEKDALAAIPELARKGQVEAETAQRQAHERATREIAKMHNDLHEQIDQMEHDTAIAGAEGYLRIEIDTENKIAALRADFIKKWGAAFIDDPKNPNNIARYEAWLAAEGDLQRGIKAIRTGGDRERVKLVQQNAEQVLQAESQAALAMVPEWQRGYQSILSANEDRLRTIQEQLGRHQIDEEEAARLTTAANIAAFGQIRDEHKRMVERLGADLESWADDIAGGRLFDRIKREFKKFMFQLLADWALGIARMKQAGNGLSAGGAGGSSFVGMLGSALGLGGSRSSGGTATSPATSAVASMAALGGMSLGSGGGIPSSGADLPGVRGLSASGASILTNNFGLGGLASQQKSQSSAANSVAGAVMTRLFGAKFVSSLNGVKMGKFSMSGSQLAMAGAGIALTGAMAGYQSGSMWQAGIGGAVGGAMTGYALAGSLGGPVGAAIGAGIFAASLFAGWLGRGKKKKQANIFADTEIIPGIKQTVDAYKNWQLDYAGATSQLGELQQRASAGLSQFGGIGDGVYKGKLQGAFAKAGEEIQRIEQERLRRNMGGRGIGMGVEQFHSGGYIGGAVGSERLILAKAGETVMNERATAENRQELDAMNRGEKSRSSGGDTYIIQAIDAKSFEQFLRDGGMRVIKSVSRRDELEYRTA